MIFFKVSRRRWLPAALLACALCCIWVKGYGKGDGGSTTSTLLACDDTIKTAFKPDANTSVVAVKAFKKGDYLILSGNATGDTPTSVNDVCMVKLNVGPGNAGPATAPSTSSGIGIEIWLPAGPNWNGRVHALGGGGWQGGEAGTATAIASTSAAAVAGGEGAVSSTTDTGHSITDNGAFAMNPDGTVSEQLWTDFASRAIHEQVVKTKALAVAYYGTTPKYSYWDGGSTGGRQGLNLAQNHPTDVDGIIAMYPAINWTRFITSELYPQIVYQSDLAGVPLSRAQSDLVSNAAIAACDVVGEQHLGYIVDPSSCLYDPLQDAKVLCSSDGGTNTTLSCVTKIQAKAVNKIWYGMTTDGSVPDPETDNGWREAFSDSEIGSSTHRWFGLNRGTTFYSATFVGLASPDMEFPISSDMVALELHEPAIAGASFVNATGNGRSLWKRLSYEQLSDAYDRGVAQQADFGRINTDSPDLSAFKNRGGKILTWHGLADELIVPQGTVKYYNRVSAQMGGIANVQSFYRLYLVPGLGHGTPNGTSNSAAVIPNFTEDQFYSLLTDWVEDNDVPDQVVLRTTTGSVTRSMPICVYPKKITYRSGAPTVSTSYGCL